MAAVDSGLDVYNVFDVDPEKPWQLLSHYFPDKIGGKPAWLSLSPLPSPEVLKCGHCGKPCVFLLQKYCPTTDFHRMIFVFVCRDASCCRKNANDNFVVLRSQLPFENEFYSKTPPDEEYFDMTCEYPRADKYTSLCAVCGHTGPKRCGKCHKETYCSKEHQTVHWKAGHRTACGNARQGELIIETTGILFPELLLDIPDDLEEIDETKDGKDEPDDKEASRELMKTLRQQGLADGIKFSTAELEEMAAGSAKEDKQFELFRKAIRTNQSQVLRYHKDGTPLWVTDCGMLTNGNQVPCCELCGAKRRFEFQVMPQLLNHLNVDDTSRNGIDWATLAVYTCSADCMSSGIQYMPEFLYKQDFDI